MLDVIQLDAETQTFEETQDKWARIWFNALVWFHGIGEPREPDIIC